MRVWAKIITEHKTVREAVGEFDSPRPSDLAGWEDILHPLCQQLDLSRPVLLQKHYQDLQRFSRAVFKASDFMEPVDFDRFEVEVLQEKKKRSSDPYAWA